MKKVLVIGNYFFPDVASLGQLITDFCLELKDDIEFNVIAAIPNYSSAVELDDTLKKKSYYDENVKGINVRRIVVPNVDKKNKISRIKYILAYYFNARKAIRNISEYDIIYTVSQPPILGGLLGKYAKQQKKNAKLIYNVQDFNPEQIEAVKYSKFRTLIKILKFIDTRSLKSSDKILLVGHDQLETLTKRDKKLIEKAIVINNWSDDKIITPIDRNDMEIIKFKKEHNLIDKFIIMYSGNIGLFYDLENLIKVTKQFTENKEIVFLFAGDGAVKKELERFKEENSLDNIVFIPYQPKAELNISLNVADVHLVVNADGIKGISVPSKLYGVMAAGKPVIGVLEKGSEARIIIEKAKCGKCVEPKKYDEFSELIFEFYLAKDIINEFGIKGREYLEKNLSKKVSINKYKELFES